LLKADFRESAIFAYNQEGKDEDEAVFIGGNPTSPEIRLQVVKNISLSIGGF
jgi:hypothetical protein